MEPWKSDHWNDFMDSIGLPHHAKDTISQCGPLARLPELKRHLQILAMCGEDSVLEYLAVAVPAYIDSKLYAEVMVPRVADLRTGLRLPHSWRNDDGRPATEPAIHYADIAVITVRQDEFTAMLGRLPGYKQTTGRSWDYQCATVAAGAAGSLNIAVGRLLDQGSLSAQMLATAMILDLNPKWILVVGIAGAIPAADYSLGDVLLSQRVHDFTVAAKAEGRPLEVQDLGGPMHPDVERLLSSIPANKTLLAGWDHSQEMQMAVPELKIPDSTDDPRLYGSTSSKEGVIQCLKSKFQSSFRDTMPTFHIGPLIDASTLVKDTELLNNWQATTRHACGIEMELAGAYRAARHFGNGQTRVLAVRGISDIVGFRRGPEWTQYACHSAASFASALIRSGLLKTA